MYSTKDWMPRTRHVASQFSLVIVMTAALGCSTRASDDSRPDGGPPGDQGAVSCSVDNGGCDAHAACAVSGNAIACTCNAGFSGDGHTCTAMPVSGPCANNADCDANATCTVEGSGHMCACNAGYEGDGKSCTPAPPNACSSNADCDANASCANQLCACNAGYQGNGKSCTLTPPPNVCSSNADCDPNASCANQLCACNAGYQGNGKSCTLVPPAALTYASNPAFYTRLLTIAPNQPSTSGGAVNSYSVTPALPVGLTLDPTSGVISGIPTGSGGTSSYEISASNAGGSAKTSLTLTIVDGGAYTIATGGSHSCALVNGGVQCWGYNSDGELGNGDPNHADSHVPVRVSGLAGGVQAISAGGGHTCAILNGGVQCWGQNQLGQLGNGDASHTSSNVPVQVVGLTSGVSAIAAGGNHTCAIVSGAVQCWGGNFTGGSTVSSDVPAAVSGLSGVTAISAGDNHSCVITSGGALLCWGWNDSGEIGSGSTSEYVSAPAQVVGLTSGVQAVSCGTTMSCAIVNGGAWCWGNNQYGRLGDNDDNTQQSNVPVQVYGLTAGVQAIASGNFTCAIVSGGAVDCWGDGFADGGGIAYARPEAIDTLATGVQDLAVSGHACVIVEGGVECFGYNTNGQLGNNSTAFGNYPMPVSAWAP